MMDKLPLECGLRRANANDSWAIIKLVISEKLDPTQLKWQQFWLIESNHNIIACGQLRQFRDAQELSSLIVISSWRKRGLGSYLARHLISQADKPLYLECLGKNLGEFYLKLGFIPISWQDLPPSLKGKFTLSNLGKTFLRIPIQFMQYQS